MTGDVVLVFGVLGASLVLFAWGRWRYEIVAMTALLSLVAGGVVPAAEAFDGFGHAAVVTVAMVLALSRALQASGAIERVTEILARAPEAAWVQTACLTATAAVLSAFMNNVGALALLLPVTIKLASQNGIPPSRLLMPLAFGSLLGGLCTLIGTPPNVIISTFRERELGAGFAMFDFTPVGVPVMLAGALVVVLLAGVLIPIRRRLTGEDSKLAVDDYTAALRVPHGGELEETTLATLWKDNEQSFRVVGLIRDGDTTRNPAPDKRLRANDTLLVETSPEHLEGLLSGTGLVMAAASSASDGSPNPETRVAEAVVRPDALLVGKTPRALRLHSRHGLAIMGISRQGRRLTTAPADTRLEAGDVILVDGDNDSLEDLLTQVGALALADRGIRMTVRSPWLTPLVFGTAIALVATGVVDVQIGLAGALTVVVLLKQLSLRDVYEAMDWPVIVLLGAMIPVGQALENTGGAGLIASTVLSNSGLDSTLVLIALTIAMAMALSNLVNNAATALLMGPIAIDVARTLESSPDPFLMAVAVGSSSAFLTPIGHQSNLLVMGPGGYRFSDYWRLGLPVSLVVVATASPVILWAFPP